MCLFLAPFWTFWVASFEPQPNWIVWMEIDFCSGWAILVQFVRFRLLRYQLKNLLNFVRKIYNFNQICKSSTKIWNSLLCLVCQQMLKTAPSISSNLERAMNIEQVWFKIAETFLCECEVWGQFVLQLLGMVHNSSLRSQWIAITLDLIFEKWVSPICTSLELLRLLVVL